MDICSRRVSEFTPHILVSIAFVPSCGELVSAKSGKASRSNATIGGTGLAQLKHKSPPLGGLEKDGVRYCLSHSLPVYVCPQEHDYV